MRNITTDQLLVEPGTVFKVNELAELTLDGDGQQQLQHAMENRITSYAVNAHTEEIEIPETGPRAIVPFAYEVGDVTKKHRNHWYRAIPRAPTASRVVGGKELDEGERLLKEMVSDNAILSQLQRDMADAHIEHKLMPRFE